MGLDITYFYSLTPRQFYNIQKGWSALRDADSKERILLTRKVMYTALAPWSKNLTEDQVWPLDFLNLEPIKAKAVDLEAIDAVAARWLDLDAKTTQDPKPLKLNDLLVLKQKNTL